MIYADNAATTKLAGEAFEAMRPFLLEEYANPSQPYSFSRPAKKALAEARATISACIGAAPEEIFFTSGGTESDNWALKGSAMVNGAQGTIITTAFEHHAVLHSCAALEQSGRHIAYLTPTEEGYITPQHLQEKLGADTFLVSVMLANNELGTIQPIKELCALTHSKGALFHTDAVQAIGHVPVDVHDLGVDLLAASAHKFNGPKGIGFLYRRKGTKLLPFADGGAQEAGMRAGTENVAAIVGMAAALKANHEAMRENAQHVAALEQKLVALLDAAGIAYRRNGGAKKLPGLLSLSFPGADGEAILHRLDLRGICVSTGSACNSKSTEISHVLKAINLQESYARGTIRISLGKDNSEEDVTIIAQELKKIFKG